ncbi:MAG: hypothetical protein K6G89_04945 [Clostridia bacterium]|nr:hypothetical protein [Clostridia bacterium]
MADKIKNSNGTKAKNDNSKNSAQKTAKKNAQQESPRVKVSTRSANYKEISAIILLMICAFLVVCITGHAGIVGSGVQSVLFGFFGLFGTIMILITMVVLAITVLRGTRSTVFTPKTTVVIIFFILFVTTLLHTLSKVYEVYKSENITYSFFTLWGSLWDSWHTDLFGGGIFAGALSTLLQELVTKVGALVVLAPVTLIFTLLLFRFSLLPFFTVVGKILAKIGKGIASLFKRLFSRQKTGQDHKPIKVVKSPAPTNGNDTEDDGDGTGDGKGAADYSFDAKEPVEIKKVIYDDLDSMPDGSRLVVDVDSTGVARPRRSFKVEFDGIEDVGEADPGPAVTSETAEAPELTVPVKRTRPRNTETGKDAWLQDKKPEKAAEPAEEELPQPGNSDDPIAIFRSIPEGKLPVLSTGEYAKYKAPPTSLLAYDIEERANAINMTNAENRDKVEKINALFQSHGVLFECEEFYSGPSFSQFVILPETGQKISSITSLSQEINVKFATKKTRLVIPLENHENAIGLELPNAHSFTVFFKEIVDSPEFKAIDVDDLPVVIGKNVRGDTIVSSMKKLLHVIVGGTTGSGKSVFTSGLVLSMVFKASPDQVRMILVDPKKLDFANFRNLPHLLKQPITEPKDATAALGWTAYEMDKRYEFLMKYDVTGIEAYNEVAKKNKLPTMPRIVVVIDEFADLLEKSDKKAEEYAVRIARLGRACGIHLVLATQRPSADVFTGNLKANIPSKCCLRVGDGVNSRIILDHLGGEALNGNGDMLFLPNKATEIKRLQNAYVAPEDIRKAVRYINENNKPSTKHIDDFSVAASRDISSEMEQMTFEGMENPEDEKYNEILRYVVSLDEVSTSELQREFNIGYNNAAGMINRLIKDGYVESAKPAGSKKRKVLRKEI